MAEQQVTPEQTMFEMIGAYWVPMAIYTTAKLRLADHLQEGPKTAAELAREAGAHEESLRRLMRALAGIGLFAEVEKGRYSLTPLSETLRSDAPNSLRAFALMQGSQWHWRGWGEFEHTVRTGQNGVEKVFGMPVFDYLDAHPEEGTTFNEAMTAVTAVTNTGLIAERYDFSQVRTVADIAGGQGLFLSHVLQAHPHLRGALVDLPSVVAQAQPTLEQRSVADRCERIGGNFFESVPAGYDLYMMKTIIHDWSDEQATAILKNCRRAMRDDARLLLIEQVMPEENRPGLHLFMDLEMLAVAGGKERTETEYRALFAGAGFELTRVIPLTFGYAILEAAPSV